MGKRGNREGSVYQTADGRWRGSVTLSGGGRKYVSGRTRDEVGAKINVLLGKVATGTPVVVGRMTVAHWLDVWLTGHAQASLRPNTFSAYQSIVTKHLVPLIGSRSLITLTPDHVVFVHRRLSERGLSGASITKVHRVLSRSLAVAQRWGYVDRNVASLVGPPRFEEAEPQFLSSEEIARLLRHLAADPSRARWHLALLGLRQGEVLGLRWEDIDLDRGVVQIRRALQRQPGVGLVLADPKSRAGKRTLGLPPAVIESLRVRHAAQSADRLRAGDLWSNRWGLVFTGPLGAPLDKTADYRRWHALLDSAGVRRVRLHDARHTAASMLLASGVGVRAAMEWLGHGQVSQTMRYTHVMPEVAQETSRRLGGVMFGPE